MNKQHHLLGLFNPAELAAYTSHASWLSRNPYYGTYLNSIRSNDSSSAFWHSLYGVKFNKLNGFLYKKIESHVDFTVQFSCEMQAYLFRCNSSVVRMFTDGKGGNAIKIKYIEWAEAKGVNLA